MRTQARVLGPGLYLLLGISLFAIKFVIDRLVASVFGHQWSFMNYLIPSETYSLYALSPQERGFYLVMVGVALPFVVVGLLLTWWRLRDAGLPRWLIVLFFMPAVNLVFFAVLGFWPSESGSGDDTKVKSLYVAPSITLETLERRSGLDPGPSKTGTEDRTHEPMSGRRVTAFLLAAAAGAASSGACIAVGVLVFRNYGWGAFVAAPFVCGMAAGWIDGLAQPRGMGESMGVAAVSLTVVGVAMVFAAFEGIACLIMAAPLAYPLALVGGLLGRALALERHRRDGRLGRGFEVLPALCAPLLISLGEAVGPAQPRLHCVTTAIIIDAPAKQVWQQVVSFPDLPAPQHWLFFTGIAHPVRARIDGSGPGATRYCEFSTGAFIEPITVWQPPGAGTTGLLRFDVTKCPAPLQEWSWTPISPPHLENFLVSRQGEFRLIPLSEGRTRLEGTTWYEHTIWPDPYWRLWSDWIIGRIHVEVLEHVSRLAQNP